MHWLPPGNRAWWQAASLSAAHWAVEPQSWVGDRTGPRRRVQLGPERPPQGGCRIWGTCAEALLSVAPYLRCRMGTGGRENSHDAQEGGCFRGHGLGPEVGGCRPLIPSSLLAGKAGGVEGPCFLLYQAGAGLSGMERGRDVPAVARSGSSWYGLGGSGTPAGLCPRGWVGGRQPGFMPEMRREFLLGPPAPAPPDTCPSPVHEPIVHPDTGPGLDQDMTVRVRLASTGTRNKG